MARMLAPTVKEVRIINGPGLSKDDPLTVVFYQATTGDLDKREQMLKRRVERSWADSGDYSESLDMINAHRQRAVEVYLTLSAFDGEDVDGKPLLKFKKKDGRMRPAYDSLDKFLAVWNRIDPEWARKTHIACLMANPTWGQAFYDEEDFDILTPGEDDGANKEQE